MKKLMYLFVAIATVLMVSCSKDQRISRQLDGEWTVTTINNAPLASGQTMNYSFTKGKKGEGTGIATWSYSFGGTTQTASEPFTYTIADEKITFFMSGDADVSTITEHSKDKMVFTSLTGDVVVLEAK